MVVYQSIYIKALLYQLINRHQWVIGRQIPIGCVSVHKYVTGMCQSQVSQSQVCVSHKQITHRYESITSKSLTIMGQSQVIYRK